MTAEIRVIVTQYYDRKLNKMKHKARPGLILKEINGDYAVIPVSTIPDKRRVDPYYDIPVTTRDYPKLNLSQDSYIRTNKQTVVNQAQIGGKISDLHAEYPDLFSQVIDKIEEFNDSIIKELRDRLT
ncbi:MAG: type II toxin-antitoxin system PemK/MazF family toxin [Ruminococcus sp.]|nr:type II toxin-antitoxin system PemK/MazF family toxin [Ruminococcus sp.]